jgi:hypothetical protein
MRDAVVTAIKGYQWEQLAPYVISLERSGFRGHKVILASSIDKFTHDCLTNRGFTVIDFTADCSSFDFVNRERFVPMLKFLQNGFGKYRHVVWVDSGDLVFQSDPSKWLSREWKPYLKDTLVVARECWRICDEPRFNLPWMHATAPEDVDFIQNEEVVCGGTLAADPATLYITLRMIYDRILERPEAFDQAALNWLIYKPFSPVQVYKPYMCAGWTATCSAFKTPTFQSIIGNPEVLLDRQPVFDKESGLVLTPDGKTPFVIVHQYNRDAEWNKLIHEKYADF